MTVFLHVLVDDTMAMIALQATLILCLAALIGSAFPKRAAVRRCIHLVALTCTLIGPLILVGCSFTGVTASIPLTGFGVTSPEVLNRTAGQLAPSQESRPGALGESVGSAEVSLPNPLAARETSIIPVRICLLTVWVVGSLMYGVGIAISFIRIRRLLRSVSPIEEEQFRAAIQQATVNLGVAKYPRLGITDRIASPVAVGLSRNAWVLIPKSCLDAMSREQLIHVLTHEGAHVLHRDPLIRFLQRLNLAFWWWNPLAYVQSNQLSRACEEACDNRVLRQVDGNAYGTTLLEMGKLISSKRDPVTSVGFFGSRWSLERRIEGMLNPGRDPMVEINRVGLVLVLCAFCGVTLLTSVARLEAQEAPKPERASDPPSSVRPVDLFIAIETTDASQQTMLISAKEKIEFKTLKAVLAVIPAVDDKSVFLTVVPEDVALHAPRTTGDQQIGINLSSDPIEVFVTDRMPYSVTSRVCEALGATGTSKAVVLKSTHRLAEQFKAEQQKKQVTDSGDDPFGN